MTKHNTNRVTASGDTMKLITPTQLKEQFGPDMIGKNDLVFIDVRDSNEYEHEHIQQATHIPLKKLHTLDPQQYSNKIGVFYCRSGNRTEINKALIDQTPLKEKYCLTGGLVGWKQAGLAVTKNVSAPIDVMRQVQLIVSIMILLGVVLSYTVSPYFILLTVLAGIGLFIAGATGFCGMANLLKFMPWNKN